MKPLPILILLAMVALVAFRPWKQTNHIIGLDPATEMLAESQDSLLMQPISIVLPQQAVDTLTERMLKRDSLKIALRKRSRLTEAEILRCQQELAKKRSLVMHLQQELVSVDEILNLTERQRKGDGKGYP